MITVLVAYALMQGEPHETVVPPEPLSALHVVYPHSAHDEGVFGTVTLAVELDVRGVVRHVVVTDSPDIRLSWAALGAMTQMRFSPARVIHGDGDSHPIAVRFTYTVAFDLDVDEGDHDHHDDAHDDDHDDHALHPHGHSDALSDVDHDDTDHDHHGEVLVRQRRSPSVTLKRQLTTPIAVLDADALARVQGRPLADAAQELPGVTMVQAGPTIGKPVIHGMFGRRVVILNDGVRTIGQSWGTEHAPEVSAGIGGEIAVIKGPAATVVGPDATGGALLLSSRPLRDQPGLDGEVSLIGVDNGLRGAFAARLDAVPEQVPSLSFRLDASANKGAAIATPDYVLGNTASEGIDIGATLQLRSSIAELPWTTTLSYRRHHQKFGVCFCLSAASPSDLRAALIAAAPVGSEAWIVSYDLERPRQEVSHDTMLVRSHLDLDGAGAITATYALQHDARDEFDQVRRSVTVPQFSFRLLSHIGDVSYHQPRLRLSNDVTLTGTTGVQATLAQNAYTGLQLLPNYQRATAGAFTLQTLTVTDVASLFNLDVTAGVRVDGLMQSAYLTDKTFESQARRGRISDADCDVDDDSARCDKTLPALSFSTGVRTRFDIAHHHNALVLSADLAHATRFADVDELYLSGRAPSAPVFGTGDASLTTERTTQVSLSGELHLPILTVDVSAFAARVDDYIAFGPEVGADGRPVIEVLTTGAFPRFSYTNIDAMLSGVDGAVVVGAGQLVSVMAQVSAVRALDLTHGGYVPFIPPLRTRVELRSHLPDVALSRGATMALGVVSMARQDRSDVRSDFAATAAASTVFYADASTELRGLPLPLWLGVEVRNLTNARYRDQLSLMRYFADQPGRELWLRLSSRFG